MPKFFPLCARWIISLFLLGLPAFAWADAESDAQILYHELRCITCQSQSLAESDAPLALEMRGFIARELSSGKTPEEIKKFLRARYGDVIFMTPPDEPGTWVLWYGPFAVVLLGVGMVALLVRRRQN